MGPIGEEHIEGRAEAGAEQQRRGQHMHPFDEQIFHQGSSSSCRKAINAISGTFLSRGPNGCSQNSGSMTAMPMLYPKISVICARHSQRRRVSNNVPTPKARSSVAAPYKATGAS